MPHEELDNQQQQQTQLEAPVENADQPLALDKSLNNKVKRERITEKLLRDFRKKADYRQVNLEPEWDDVWDAYRGVIPDNIAPYQSYYAIKEIFRQVEALKPHLASILLPDDDRKFEYKPRSDGDQDNALASTNLVHYQLETLGLNPEILTWLDEHIVWGVSYLQYGWNKFKQVPNKISGLDDEDDHDTVEEPMDGPWLKWIDHWSIYTDAFTVDLTKSTVHKREIVSIGYLKTRVAEGHFKDSLLKKALKLGATDKSRNIAPTRIRTDVENSQKDINERDEYVLLTTWTNDGWEYAHVNGLMVMGRRNPFGEVPILALRNYPQHGEHYGLGEPRVLLDDQRLLQDMCSMWVDTHHFNNNPMWKVNSEVEHKINIGEFKPGGKFIVDRADDIMPLETNSSQTFDLGGAIQAVRSFMQDTTGVTPELTGQGSSQRTASGLARLQNAATLRIQHKIRKAAPVFNKLYRILHMLNRRFLDKSVPIRIFGAMGREAFASVDKEAFTTDIDVEVNLPPAMMAPQELQAKWIQLWQIVRPDPMFDAEPTAIELLRAFGMKNPRRSLSNGMSAQEDALGEVIDWMSMGVLPDVKPTDRHDIHVSLMLAFENSPEFSQSNEVTRQNWDAHKQQHMTFLEQQGEELGGLNQIQTSDQGPGDLLAGTSAATEAQFSNGDRGAAQQGVFRGA